MRKKLSSAAVVAAMATFAFAPAGASAKHCVDDGRTTPGFSYFGNDHVAGEDAHGGTPEGGNPGPHMGTSGASNCRETTGSPSKRGPGQQPS